MKTISDVKIDIVPYNNEKFQVTLEIPKTKWFGMIRDSWSTTRRLKKAFENCGIKIIII